MRIFLADLGHNQLTFSSDIYPLGVANLAIYTREYLDSRHSLDIKIFREPADLKTALDSAPPDILGLSSYSWNHNLSLHFASYAKARNPKMLTLMGGPNFPLTAAEQESFLRGMSQIDIAVRGPTYEGERAFLNIVRRLAEVGGSGEGVFEEPVAGNMWIHPRTNEFIVGGEVERMRDLDEIPSPYLAGLMDDYFKTGYFPMMQIARGCPFSCTYCNSSVEANSKIYAHSVENVKADLQYIAERIRPEVTLCFADDNFGMYQRDEEIAEYIRHLQERYNWPQYLRTTTGKNRGERIIKVMRTVKGRLPMTAAVQSLDPAVLKNIKRANISLNTFADIQKEVIAQGMQSYGELILSMPGETKASFMKAVSDLLEAGVKRISAHQLMLLHGAPLSNPESRDQFQFKTRFRVVARNIGNYTGQPVIETEEMVVETPDFSFDEYLEARVFHLLLTIFYYEGNFEEAFEYARHEGIKPFDLMVRMQQMLDQAPPKFRAMIDDFLQESQEELFQTREACIEWARQNFDSLVNGSKGGNLLSKYSMLGRFYLTQEAIEFLQTVISSAQDEAVLRTDLAQLQAVTDYLRCILLHVPFAEVLASNPEWTASYDVEAWRKDGYADHLDLYAFDQPRSFATAVDADKRAMIETRIATFGEHPSGLGKFTRTMFAHDLRRTVVGAKAGIGA
ncbi:MAG TPA: radical SAM protein [Blastocatellia bacterium]|nr:radical SAM protein [Blastocatellia bacterium]